MVGKENQTVSGAFASLISLRLIVEPSSAFEHRTDDVTASHVCASGFHRPTASADDKQAG